LSEKEKELEKTETCAQEEMTGESGNTNQSNGQSNSEIQGSDESESNIETDDLKEELRELTKEKEDLYQSYIRLKADFDNYRRRTREELGQAQARGLEETVLKLLPVLDNLERAIDASGDPHKWREGVEMVYRQFLGVLEGEGLTPIPSLGQEFDPTKHEAIARETSEQQENIIIEVLQKGYQLGEKTIRASLVKVSAGKDG